jgi:hypothetical protein
MKKTIIFLMILASVQEATAQLQVKTTCPPIEVDIMNGKVNGEVKASFIVAEIKARIPCFTSAEEESATAKCGGGVYYKDKDISFYTERDYIEIGPKFKGKLSLPVMGAPRNGMFKWFGNVAMKDANWDAFQMSYGTLILYYTAAGKVNKILLSTRGTDTIKLCE